MMEPFTPMAPGHTSPEAAITILSPNGYEAKRGTEHEQYICIYINTYMYMYREREREKKKERGRDMYQDTTYLTSCIINFVHCSISVHEYADIFTKEDSLKVDHSESRSRSMTISAQIRADVCKSVHISADPH